MNRTNRSHLEEIDMIGKLADLKTDHYNQSLILKALIELLIEKEICSRQEIADQVERLDSITLDSNHPTA